MSRSRRPFFRKNAFENRHVFFSRPRERTAPAIGTTLLMQYSNADHSGQFWQGRRTALSRGLHLKGVLRGKKFSSRLGQGMGFKDLSERHDVKVRRSPWGVTSFSSKLLGSSGLMLAVKLLGAAAAYALAWWVSRHEGPSAYGHFELALTVLTIAALAARLGLDGVLVKWMSASNVKGDQGVQRRLVGRVMAVTGLLAAPVLAAVMWWASPGLTSWLGDETLDCGRVVAGFPF